MRAFSILVLIAAISGFSDVPAIARPDPIGVLYGPGGELPSSIMRFRVDSLEFEILNAFDDAKAHTAADRWLYAMGNRLHITTRESVVRRNLLFAEGDTINHQELLESERQLRRRNYLSDASITRRTDAQGRNILRVRTSDHWTTTLAFSPRLPTGEGWDYSIGLIESNFLGYGQTLGFFFSHDEQRDMRFMIYDNPQFLWKHHRLAATFSDNSDGFHHTLFFQKPFVTRSREEWSYTAEAVTIKEDRFLYIGKHGLPMVQTSDTAAVGTRVRTLDSTQANVLASYSGVRQDSLRLEFGRSLHGALSLQMRVSYDWQREAWGAGPHTARPVYSDGEGGYWRADSSLYSQYTREWQSRPGVGLTVSRLRYARVVNYHKVKWTEDVDRGWSWSGHLSRNLEWLGAANEDWRFVQVLAGAAGMGGYQHLTGSVRTEYWWDGSRKRDVYGALRTEYQWKPTVRHSTVLNGLADAWWAADPKEQLVLGGLVGLNGFPTAFLAGQARTLLEAEQRWFPPWEWGTVVPVFTAFWQAGGAWESPRDFNPDEWQQVVGLGLRAGLSKSTQGVVNHLNLSWPINGPLENGWKGVRFSILAKQSL